MSNTDPPPDYASLFNLGYDAYSNRESAQCPFEKGSRECGIWWDGFWCGVNDEEDDDEDGCDPPDTSFDSILAKKE